MTNQITANRGKWKTWLAVIVTAAVILYSAAGIDYSGLQYFSPSMAADVFRGLMRPDWSFFYDGSGEDLVSLLLLTVGIAFLGTSIATVLAQAVVSLLFVLATRRDTILFGRMKLGVPGKWADWAEIGKIGLPVAAQSIVFSSLSMIIARIIAGWGDTAVAVQKVGSQIESISWMTADGFATALNAFVAQNHGAGKKERIRKGYQVAMGLMGGWGLFTSLVLILFPEVVFRIFITEAAVLPMGVSYLRIMGFSQLFMCMESTTAGAFQGLGRPVTPTVVGITGNLLRIPLALLLSATLLGLDGIWWSISISSILKGIVVPVWFAFVLRAFMNRDVKTI